MRIEYKKENRLFSDSLIFPPYLSSFSHKPRVDTSVVVSLEKINKQLAEIGELLEKQIKEESYDKKSNDEKA